jgi:MFS transporter, FHS family, L-fucose permease
MNNIKSNTSRYALYVLTAVFFFWGFVASSNTVLIPFFKENFSLAQWQSQLVDLAFYAAYFGGSLAYFLYSMTHGDLLNRIGYKKGLLAGFGLSALGALMFIPAAGAESYSFLLIALFTIGLGFTLQQIVANPYVIAIGDPKTGAHRINLAQGVNSFGTMTGPVLLSWALFGNLEATSNHGLDIVKAPYLILAICLIIFAALLGYSRLPAITNTTPLNKDLGALKYPQLVLGMMAIFIYVGVEVSIQSNLPALMQDPKMLGLPHTETVHYISLYWGSLMIGRWTAAIGVFNPKKWLKLILTTILPISAFGVILLVNALKGSPVADMFGYLPFIGIAILGFYLGGNKPTVNLLLFSVLGMSMMFLGLFLEGKWAVYAFVSGGLFCSIMWPSIFSLSIAGLGKYTNQGSALLVMMILGGAIIPPLQGYIADLTSIQSSYWIPFICFGLLAGYALAVKQVLIKQGINYDH